MNFKKRADKKAHNFCYKKRRKENRQSNQNENIGKKTRKTIKISREELD